MSDAKISVISSVRKPDPELVGRLESILEQAKSGELQSFFGAGTMINGDVLTTRGPSNNLFSDLGAIELLKSRMIGEVE